MSENVSIYFEFRKNKKLPERTEDFLKMKLEEYPEIRHPEEWGHDDLIAHLAIRGFLLEALDILKAGEECGDR